MKNILITGGAGFIGSNCVQLFVEQHPENNYIILDKLTYAGNMENLKGVSFGSRNKFIQGDITNSELVDFIFREYNINGVIHFAAESHVDNSISGPEIFMRTNVLGTQILLDTARKHWMNSPFSFKDDYKDSRFLHISTDEVYGTLGEEGLFTETTAYQPNSPYSASKAGSDMIVRAYHHTYGMNVVTTNCSNNYGPRQHSEKFIPTIIRKALALEPIPIYGDGKNIRDWLYVMDHCRGIWLAFGSGKSGEVYNIGGRNERKNLYIAQTISERLDKKRPRGDGKSYIDLITFVKDRPGHDQRYAIDATKIETELNWNAEENFESGIDKTIDWYLEVYFTSK